MEEVMIMLTPRQKEILFLIVQLYGQYLEPVGSKRLLKESLLKVSPATIRNDMVVLEQEGFLNKAHSSSGRIPSNLGYRYYVDRLIVQEHPIRLLDQDHKAIEQMIDGGDYDAMQLAQLALEMLVNITGYTGFVLGENNEKSYFQEIKIIPLSDNKVITMLVQSNGKIENKLFRLPLSLSEQDIQNVTHLINDELSGSLLEDAYQRLKLSIPLQIQRLIGYQLDFSELVEQALLQQKAHQYIVKGKLNLFDLMESQLNVDAMKNLFQLIDGSKQLYELLEMNPENLSVLFGFEFAPESLSNISIVYIRQVIDNQLITLGLIGPSTMPYDRIINLMYQMAQKFENS